MKLIHSLLLSLLIAAVSWSISEARTWQVEKDGSGDFTVIQHAVDAAESGDEILIGPGRYDDYTILFEGGSLYWDLYVRVTGKSLSLVGAGVDQTIIGPVDSSVNVNDAVGIACMEGPSTISISGISFDRINYQCIWLNAGHLEVENCSFSNGNKGVVLKASDGGHITDCHFENMSDIGVIGHPPSVGFVVKDCTFDTVYGGVSFFWGGCEDCHIRNCTMDGKDVGRVGASFNSGASGSISNCYFTGFLNTAVGFSDGGEVACFDNVIEQDTGGGVVLNGCEFLDFHDNIISSNNVCVFINYPHPMSFHNNHIFRGEGAWFVKTNTYYPYGPVTVDMSGNWWGTTDLDEFEEWTYDGNDNSNVWIYVDYQPLADGPVSVESISLDSLKALFR